MTLREYLSRSGETEAAFGVRIGVSQAAVSRWVNGLRTPSKEFIIQIAKETGDRVKPADWFADTAA